MTRPYIDRVVEGIYSNDAVQTSGSTMSVFVLLISTANLAITYVVVVQHNISSYKQHQHNESYSNNDATHYLAIYVFITMLPVNY